jgi:hypothetical protein
LVDLRDIIAGSGFGKFKCQACHHLRRGTPFGRLRGLQNRDGISSLNQAVAARHFLPSRLHESAFATPRLSVHQTAIQMAVAIWSRFPINWAYR